MHNPTAYRARIDGIVLLTFRELWAKKITLGLFIVSTLIWAMLAFALNLDIVDGTLAGLRIFGQETTMTVERVDPNSNPNQPMGDLLSLETIVMEVERVVAGMAYWMGILLALFATAPLMTALLETGRIDLMLAKPVSRSRLLLGHLAGVWLAMALLAVYLLGMVWLVMSLKSGVWNPRFLITIGLVVGMFAVMYSVVTLFGVWTQSTALALIVAYGLIFASIILSAKEQLAPQINPPWRAVYVGFYHVLPNFAEVTATVGRLSTGEAVASWYPVVSSGLFGLALYAAAFVLFARRDF